MLRHEASLKPVLPRDLDVGDPGFLVLRHEASLKHQGRVAAERETLRFPRASARGLIEADTAHLLIDAIYEVFSCFGTRPH